VTPRNRLLLSTVAGTLASAAYWWLFFMVAFSITAGDYRSDSVEPSQAEAMVTSFLVYGGGVVIYAIGAWFWRKMDFRIAGPRDD
jgi:hypothetical protein